MRRAAVPVVLSLVLGACDEKGRTSTQTMNPGDFAPRGGGHGDRRLDDLWAAW